MSLKRYTKVIDGTIPIQALLYQDEELQASQESVGIYDGQRKAPKHQSGVVHVTSHRLFFYSSHSPARYSFSLELSYITQTDYYAGLFTSSAKVTLHLAPLDEATHEPQREEEEVGGWECQVCSYRNPPGTSRNAQVCGLCGVPRSSSQEPVSTSLPASRSSTPSSSVSCTACTFLNETSLTNCTMCGTPLPTKRASTAPPSPALTDVGDLDPPLIKLSFRKGGDKGFYTILKRSLQGKTWENRAARKRSDTPVLGIDGIMKNAASSAESSRLDMNDALKDLEAFMVKTRDMVRLAQDLNERLSATKSSSEPEEATFIRSSLSQLGLEMKNTPVTLDMMKDEKKWEEELARELADVVQGSGPNKGIMKGRGIIGLDEIWGGWNRARGVALIPPSTFLTIVSGIHPHTSPPLSTRTFPNGLMVLHTPEYSEQAFTRRLFETLISDGGKTTSEIARDENLGLGMVWEMVQGVEQHGDIVRDEGSSLGSSGEGAEVRWWVNLFTGYVWDGHVES